MTVRLHARPNYLSGQSVPFYELENPEMHDPEEGQAIDVSAEDAAVWKVVVDAFRQMESQVWERLWKGPLQSVPAMSAYQRSGVLPASPEEIKDWYRTTAMHSAVQDQMRRALFPQAEFLATPTDTFEFKYFADYGNARFVFKNKGSGEEVHFQVQLKELPKKRAEADGEDVQSFEEEDCERQESTTDPADWWKV